MSLSPRAEPRWTDPGGNDLSLSALDLHELSVCARALVCRFLQVSPRHAPMRVEGYHAYRRDCDCIFGASYSWLLVILPRARAPLAHCRDIDAPASFFRCGWADAVRVLSPFLAFLLLQGTRWSMCELTRVPGVMPCRAEIYQ